GCGCLRRGMGAGGGEEMVQWVRAEESLEVESESGGRAKMEKIVVSVRLRPLNEKEVAENDPSDWECINDTTIIFRNSLSDRSMNPTAYTFAIEIYNEAVRDLLSTDSAPLRLLDDPETIESSAREFLGKDNSSSIVASVV
ncbi:hypothetical protein BHE74_00010994, partial [Ensete ventricosum]